MTQRAVSVAANAHSGSDAAVDRAEGEAEKIRRYSEFAYAAKSWMIERRAHRSLPLGPVPSRGARRARPGTSVHPVGGMSYAPKVDERRRGGPNPPREAIP